MKILADVRRLLWDNYTKLSWLPYSSSGACD